MVERAESETCFVDGFRRTATSHTTIIFALDRCWVYGPLRALIHLAARFLHAGGQMGGLQKTWETELGVP